MLLSFRFYLIRKKNGARCESHRYIKTTGHNECSVKGINNEKKKEFEFWVRCYDDLLALRGIGLECGMCLFTEKLVGGRVKRYSAGNSVKIAWRVLQSFNDFFFLSRKCTYIAVGSDYVHCMYI